MDTYWTPLVTFICSLLATSAFRHGHGSHNDLDGFRPKHRTQNETKALDLIERLLELTDYRIRPHIYGKPIEVLCDFYIQSIGSINAVDMDFQVDVFFRQKWRDERFAFDDFDEPVIIPSQLIPRFWVPDIFFTNEKEAEVHDVTVLNQVIKIFPEGLIRLSTRMTIKLACPMVLKNFPLDYQDCNIRFSSYSYTTKDVLMTWGDENPVELNEDELYLPQFQLIGTNVTSCADKLKTGSFPCLKVIFHFQRLFGYYLLQAYMPSFLIVILSWVSFWVHKEAVPARITLGVTTVLTMTTQLTSSSSNQIQVSYAKAIDIWYASCMILVFSALIEYALVNSWSRLESKRDEKKNKRKNMIQDMTVEMPQNSDEVQLDGKSKKGKHRDSRETKGFLRLRNGKMTSDGLDRISRIVFPSLFVIFNIVYWIYFSQEIVYSTKS